MSPVPYKYGCDTPATCGVCLTTIAKASQNAEMIERDREKRTSFSDKAADCRRFCYRFELKMIYTTLHEPKNKKNDQNLSLRPLDIVHLFSYYFTAILSTYRTSTILNIHKFEVMQISLTK